MYYDYNLIINAIQIYKKLKNFIIITKNKKIYKYIKNDLFKKDIMTINNIVFKYIRVNSFYKICRYCYSISISYIYLLDLYY